MRGISWLAANQLASEEGLWRTVNIVIQWDPIVCIKNLYIVEFLVVDDIFKTVR